MTSIGSDMVIRNHRDIYTPRSKPIWIARTRDLERAREFLSRLPKHATLSKLYGRQRADLPTTYSHEDEITRIQHARALVGGGSWSSTRPKPWGPAT